MNAMNAHRNMTANTVNAGKSMEKLSSGLRINRAGDDAAGLAISEKMRGQIRGLDQGARNAQDGISMIQTAEGGLSETHAILQRMNELATQGANGSLAANDRTAIGNELTQLNSEIDRISTATKFNGQTLLAGTFGVQAGATSGIKSGTAGVTGVDISGANASTTYTLTTGGAGDYTLTDGTTGDVQNITLADATAGVINFDKLGVKITVDGSQTAAGVVAANAGGGGAGTIITGASAAVNIQIGNETSGAERLGVTINKMDTSATSLNTATISVATEASSRTAMDTIQGAVDKVSLERSRLGAYQNRLEHTITNLNTSSENLTSAESRIRDVDMAKEMMTFSKNNILSQAAQSMISQANQQPQGVLQLLR
jgi:flagellin